MGSGIVKTDPEIPARLHASIVNSSTLELFFAGIVTTTLSTGLFRTSASSTQLLTFLKMCSTMLSGST